MFCGLNNVLNIDTQHRIFQVYLQTKIIIGYKTDSLLENAMINLMFNLYKSGKGAHA